jgi:hypothetical protein
LNNFGVDQQDAAQSIAHLKGMAGEMLAVLFNVFSSVAREQRGQVGDVIGLWLGIMEEKVRVEQWPKTTRLLLTSLKCTGNCCYLREGNFSFGERSLAALKLGWRTSARLSYHA